MKSHLSLIRRAPVRATGGLTLALLLSVLWLAGCSPQRSLQAGPSEQITPRPNIVLIVFEDLSPRIGAFGDEVATTPILDSFAKAAVRYPNTFTTSGVCAPSRSSLITGVHQQTLGTQHMRTRSPVPQLKGGGPIEYDAVPPPQVKAFPELLRAAGYYTTNDGKTDYQFGAPFTVWDENGPEANWRGRAGGQPFFAMFNPQQTHESYIWPEDRQTDNPLIQLVTDRNRRELAAKERVTDPATVEVPPYLPDTPIVRADIARHYDNLAFAEKRVAQILAMLDADGLLEETIIIVTSDHGDGLPRMKRTVYDSGIRVPMMIRHPEKADAGLIDEGLVSFVDLAPTILEWAGVGKKDWQQGRVLGEEPKREYIFAASDRFDSAPGRSKAVFDGRFKYIRNFMPGLPVLQPLPFRDAQPTMQEIWRLDAAGQLTLPTRALLEPRAPEELYDLSQDRHEIVNLAGDAAYRDKLGTLRLAMDDWLARTGDLSAMPEIDMIRAMWPGLVQPVTQAPIIGIEGTTARITSPTPGASIAYSLEGSDPTGGRVYAGPVALNGAERVSAKAIRYGYAPSETVTLTMP
jgi:arylsulfatase A-like enzyme